MQRQALRRIRQGFAVLGLAVLFGCNLSQIAGPSSPPPPPPPDLGPRPNVAGVWRGKVTVVDCGRTQGDGPDPCDDRRGRVEPVALNISHFNSSVENVDLKIAFEAFVPAARGTCYGTRDPVSIFFQGLITRPADRFDVLVTFKGQLDGDRIESLENPLVVNVTLRNSFGWQSFVEQWNFSPIIRQ